MIEWRRLPRSLWAYAAAMLLGTILIEVKIHGQVPSKVLFPFVMFAWLFFLLKGVRWVWIVTVGISILGFVPDVISGSIERQGIVLGLVGPVLLLLPSTRRYFSGHAATAGA